MDLDLTAQQETLRQAAVQFARERVAPWADVIDERGEFPVDLIEEAGRLGLMGLTTPQEWGGGGHDYVGYALALEAIARASATVAVILSVNNSLVAETIARFGSRAQKARWLHRLAAGSAIGAFALSEEHAGTDAQNQRTVAAPIDGSSDRYRLNGKKVWVANAEAAKAALVFAAVAPAERDRQVTAFLIPMDAPGLVRTAHADSLGVRGLGCMDLELDDVEVTDEDRVGPVGEGFQIALWALDGGRVAIAAQALGVGLAALDEALVHAKRRQTFGRPIGAYQAIQFMLADMATELDAARLVTLKAASLRDSDRIRGEAAMAKLLASEAAHRAADKAMQILASAGYRRGSKVERLFRDARATEIYQGTSEAQRLVIAASILPMEKLGRRRRETVIRDSGLGIRDPVS
ncbi:MAG: acyl-CoA dehydrogenase family protein [Acidobacteria bacterium]|nr:acyl-CoA dehydrogenase family protein [Acidobacteriota bacterium]